MKDTLNEKILLFRLQTRQDADAFEELYWRYRPALFRFIYVRVPAKEVAEDIISEVFIEMWRYVVEEGRRINHFRGLAYKIARNQIATYYRSNGPDHIPLHEISEEVLKYENEYQEVDTELLQAIFSLKPEDAEIMMLRYVEELRVRDIADIVGKEASAVSARINRLLKKLKEELTKEK